MNDIDDAADELTQRYRRASAADPSRPSVQTRAAITAQARTAMTYRTTRAADEAALTQMEASPAANDSRWRLRAVAALAVVGVVGLIATQTLRQSPKPDSPAAEVVASAPPQLPQPSVPSVPSVPSEKESRPAAAAGGAAMEASNARSVARADMSPPVSDAPAPAAPDAAPPVAKRLRFERDANVSATAQGLAAPANSSDQKAVAGGDSNNDVQLTIAQSYFLQGRYQQAATSTEEMIARDERTGQRPAEASLRLLVECYRKLNNGSGEKRAVEKLRTYYPEAFSR